MLFKLLKLLLNKYFFHK